jgi:glycosyltransferase involved in cell wall biosynthesis
MNVCLLSYRGNPYSGGQGIYLYHLTRELARLGHQVDVVVGPPYPVGLDGWARVHRIENLNLWGVYAREWLPPRPLHLLRPLNLLDFAATRLRFFSEPLTFSLRALARLPRLIERRGLDLLHDVQTLGYGMRAMQGFGLPLLTTVHHPLTIDRAEAFARNRTYNELYHTAVFYPVGMQGFVIRRADRVITASRAGREAIGTEFRVPPRRISVVPNGLDTGFFRDPGRWKREAARLLFVGNTDDFKKGAEFLVEALALLPASVRLRIVDEDYPLRSRVLEASARLGVEQRIEVTGRLDAERLREEYCRCTLLVQPSLYEGFGLPAAEALACGTPVVATAVGAVPEVVTPETGVLVPPRDPGALADAILSLLDDPARRERMGAAGRERMARHFSWERCGERTAAVYADVRSGVPGAAPLSFDTPQTDARPRDPAARADGQYDGLTAGAGPARKGAAPGISARPPAGEGRAP